MPDFVQGRQTLDQGELQRPLIGGIRRRGCCSQKLQAQIDARVDLLCDRLASRKDDGHAPDNQEQCKDQYDNEIEADTQGHDRSIGGN